MNVLKMYAVVGQMFVWIVGWVSPYGCTLIQQVNDLLQVSKCQPLHIVEGVICQRQGSFVIYIYIQHNATVIACLYKCKYDINLWPMADCIHSHHFPCLINVHSLFIIFWFPLFLGLFPSINSVHKEIVNHVYSHTKVLLANMHITLTWIMVTVCGWTDSTRICCTTWSLWYTRRNKQTYMSTIFTHCSCDVFVSLW